jgi:hypothetical protein
MLVDCKGGLTRLTIPLINCQQARKPAKRAFVSRAAKRSESAASGLGAALFAFLFRYALAGAIECSTMSGSDEPIDRSARQKKQ